MTASISRIGLLTGAVLGVALSLAAAAATKPGKSWPPVTIQHHNYVFDGRSSYASAGVTIFNAADGKALYNLTCHNAQSGSAANYGGLIECRLFSVADDTVNLFRPPSDAAAATVRRAQFFGGHTRPGCRKFKYWGSVRDFDLRGMRITLTVHDFIPASGATAARFQLDIDTADRPGATGAFATSVREMLAGSNSRGKYRLPRYANPPWWFLHPRAACSQITAPAN